MTEILRMHQGRGGAGRTRSNPLMPNLRDHMAVRDAIFEILQKSPEGLTVNEVRARVATVCDPVPFPRYVQQILADASGRDDGLVERIGYGRYRAREPEIASREIARCGPSTPHPIL
jgi:hypothetical protein